MSKYNPQTKEYSFNLNQFVKVKLSPTGREVFAQKNLEKQERYATELMNKGNSRHVAMQKAQELYPLLPHTDAEGYYVTQFWCLLENFHIGGWGARFPFEEIFIQD